MFGRNIIHGFLGGSVFTKIFGALWKADGHVYLKQTMQWLKPMDPARRILSKVTIENATEASYYFSILMGDDVPPRREFIETHAHYARIDV